MATSAVPLPAAFFHALLQQLARHPDGARRKDIRESVADRMGLTPEQRAELLPSGAHLRYRHRIGWSLNMMKTAGYAEPLGQGVWKITPAGRELLAKHPEGFDEQTTKEIVRRARSKGAPPEAQDDTNVADEATAKPPEERIDEAVEELNDQLASELLDRIAAGSPDFFERLAPTHHRLASPPGPAPRPCIPHQQPPPLVEILLPEIVPCCDCPGTKFA